jgi:hypothetical protein
MTTKTKIEWTEQTWNPTTGCDKVSPGCKHCYAEKMAHRLKAMGAGGYDNGFELSLHEKRLNQPLRRKKPTMYSLISTPLLASSSSAYLRNSSCNFDSFIWLLELSCFCNLRSISARYAGNGGRLGVLPDSTRAQYPLGGFGT